MKTCLILGAVALIASSSHAGFSGYTVEQVNTDAGNTQFRVYANFDASGFVMLNILGFQSVSGAAMNARHQDNATDANKNPSQSWNPGFNGTLAVRNEDSWVTASGSSASGNNDTSLDPSFTPSNSSYIPNTSGWYDATPGAPNNVLAGGASHRMLVLQIVRSGTGADAYATSTFSMVTGYKVALTTTAQFGNGSFTIPAPGALALVGLVGAFGRRRRSSL